jgi:prepilin-type processing-associated H-X9-DG protein
MATAKVTHELANVLVVDARLSQAHPGGVTFTFADGSVQFLSDGIEHLVYRARSTRAGNLVVSF